MFIWSGAIEYVEELLCRQVPVTEAVRFIALLGACGALRGKTLPTLQTMLLHSYGYHHIVTLHRLTSLGIMGRPSALAGLCKALPLLGDADPAAPDTPYVFYGYAPLSAHVAHLMATSASAADTLGPLLAGGDGVCPIFAVPAIQPRKPARQARAAAPPAAAAPAAPGPTVLVVFLGGATMSELAALRALGRQHGVRYVAMVTSLLTSSRLLKSVLDP